MPQSLNTMQKRKIDRFNINYTQISSSSSFGYHTNNVVSIALSNDGNLCVTGSKDLTVKIWNVKTNCEILTLVGHVNTVNFVAFTV